MSFDFNLNDAQETGLLAEGFYVSQVEEAQEKPTKAGDGKYVSMKFRVIDGPAEGRIIYHNFNTYNKNDLAQKIGRGQLKQLARVAGLDPTKITGEQDFVGVKAILKVTIKEDRNNVTDFKAYSLTAQSQAAISSDKDVPFA